MMTTPSAGAVPTRAPESSFDAPANLVLGTWAAATVAAMGFVLAYGQNSLYGEAPEIEPYVDGQPITLHWLLAPHNEHRIPLPKLLLLIIGWVTGKNWYMAALLNVAILSAAALGGIMVCRRLRGSFKAADAFFPLLLLSWGNSHNLLSGWQLQFTLSIGLGLATAFLLIREPLSKARAALAGACVAALPPCGGSGVILALPLLALLILLAVGHARKIAVAAWLAVGVAATVTTLAICWPGPTAAVAPTVHGAGEFLQSAVYYLTLGFGAPYCPKWAVCLTGAVLLATGIVSLAAHRKAGPNAEGWIAAITGAAILAVLICDSKGNLQLLHRGQIGDDLRETAANDPGMRFRWYFKWYYLDALHQDFLFAWMLWKVLAAVSVLSAVVLLVRGLLISQIRQTVLVVGALMFGAILMAVSLGISRVQLAIFPPMTIRHVLLMAPVPVATYLAWETCSRGWIRRLGQPALAWMAFLAYLSFIPAGITDAVEGPPKGGAWTVVPWRTLSLARSRRRCQLAGLPNASESLFCASAGNLASVCTCSVPAREKSLRLK